MERFTRQTTRRNDSKIAGMYDLEEKLGAGHFAEVKLARHVFTGERVAVKVIDKLKLDDTAKHHLFQEVRCMKLVQHPNIVRLYEVIDTKTKLYLVQELGDGGDMYDYIMKHDGGLSEEKARRYFRQILQAIDYCHKLHVVHRDLKPENVIFFKKCDMAKLTDFGFSNKFLPGKKLETACGSLAYSAPEILLGDSYDAPAVDVWSLGVILFMMVVGRAPFYEANESETLTMILDCKFHVPDHVSLSCNRLISRMIVRDASKRASLADIMADPWILEGHGPLKGTTVPLANRVSLGVDQHNEVVKKMLLGEIADKETIKQCLESGSYNHVTATYYLLAEQVLRRLHWHKNLSSSSLAAKGGENKSPEPKRSDVEPPCVEQSLADPCTQNNAADLPVDGSSVEELPVEGCADKEEEEVLLGDIDANLLTSRLQYHSTESIYDRVKNGDDKEHNEDEMVGTVSVSMTKKQRRTFHKKRVAKVKSTPAFLNQISEERESDLDDSPRASPRVRRPSRRPLDVLKTEQKTRRPSPASSSGGRRSSSVSSSSEDDGDLDKRMRRLSTERCRRSPKRRSDDEGDGDDGEGGARSPSGVARKKKMSESPQSRGVEGGSAGSGNGSNVQGKCVNTCLRPAVLKDKLVQVTLQLNEACPVAAVIDKPDHSRPMDTGNVSENAVNSSNRHFENLAEFWSYNANESESPVGMGTVCSDSDKAVSDDIVKDGLPERIALNDEMSKNGSLDHEFPDDGATKESVGERVVEHDIVDEILNDDTLDSCASVKESLDDGNADPRLTKGKLVKQEITSDDNEGNEIEDSRHLQDGIIEIFREGKGTKNGSNENVSDKENENFPTNAETDFRERDCWGNAGAHKVVLRGSDIEEIEMYMRAKDAGLELNSVTVRTIFNNRKVSRVTSNCCQII